MDWEDIATNCLCFAHSFPTCLCPDSELADGHRGECQYRRMAEVMKQLDAARTTCWTIMMTWSGVSKMSKKSRRGSGISCCRTTHGVWCLSWTLTCSCQHPRTNCINGMHFDVISIYCYVPVYTCICRYIHIYTCFMQVYGLFGDHIVPSVLYRYTQVLLCADLVNSKGKPLVTKTQGSLEKVS